MCSPAAGLRRSAWSLIVALMLAVVTPLTPALANPARTDLNTQVAADSSGAVSIAGTLVDGQGYGVPGVTVSATVAGQPMQNVTTGADGSFSMQFQVPAELTNGAQELRVGFAGNGSHAASVKVYSLGFEAQGQTNSQGGATTLTLDVGVAETYPGAVLDVSGRLTLATGEAVASATIAFSFRGASLTAPSTVTAADGSYSASVEIPTDAAEGEGELVATFSGAANLEAAKAAQPLTIAAPVASPSPSPSPSQSAAEAVESAEPSAALSSSAAVAAAPAAEASSEGASGSLVMWFLVAAVAVLAVGGATLLVVVARTRRRDTDEAEFGGLIGEPGDVTVDPMDPQPMTVAVEPPTTTTAAPTQLSPTPPTAQDAVTAVMGQPVNPQPEVPKEQLPQGWFRDGEPAPGPVRPAEPSAAETTAIRPRRRP